MGQLTKPVTEVFVLASCINLVLPHVRELNCLEAEDLPPPLPNPKASNKYLSKTVPKLLKNNVMFLGLGLQREVPWKRGASAMAFAWHLAFLAERVTIVAKTSSSGQDVRSSGLQTAVDDKLQNTSPSWLCFNELTVCLLRHSLLELPKSLYNYKQRLKKDSLLLFVVGVSRLVCLPGE
eukprot:5164811-Amphidinium_carterae.1